MKNWVVLAFVVVFPACGPHVVRGEFVGSTYVNKTAGYGFSVPAGWQVDDRSPAVQGVEFALRRNTSLILGSPTGSWTVVQPRSPGPISGNEKAQMLREWFPEIPVSEHGKLTMEVGPFGPTTFVLVRGPDVCSFSDRVEATTTNRPWDRFALTHSSGYAYMFFGNICDPDAGGSFEELLSSVRLLK